VFRDTSPRPPDIEPNWGNISPTVDEESPSIIPFRPAVATAFLYTPLLAWDLNTLAGALFSSILLNRNDDLPDSKDILNCARILITGRMIQTLITPHGFDSIDGMEIDEEDEEGRWDPKEMQKESEALAKLYSHCRARVLTGSLDGDAGLIEGRSGVESPSNLFGNVGRSEKYDIAGLGHPRYSYTTKISDVRLFVVARSYLGEPNAYVFSLVRTSVVVVAVIFRDTTVKETKPRLH